MEKKYPKWAKISWIKKQEEVLKSGKKKCTKCGATKPLADFPKKKQPKGRNIENLSYAYCKVCHSEYQRNVTLKRKYGITVEQYEEILQYQKGVCAICGKPPKEGHARLSVDHCHKTGLLRGLLCWLCNRLLGSFRDDKDRLKSAIEYLTTPPISHLYNKNLYTAPGRVGSKKRAKLLKQLVKE